MPIRVQRNQKMRDMTEQGSRYRILKTVVIEKGTKILTCLGSKHINSPSHEGLVNRCCHRSESQQQNNENNDIQLTKAMTSQTLA
eukprot:scaffold235460_cov18-Prasinocladus_malaysianus.AAC.1